METNLSVLKRTRGPPAPGDVVALHVRDKGWLFGRVVNPRAKTDPLERPWEAVLLYVFKGIAPAPVPPPSLPVANLLLPPQLVAPDPWMRGYVRFIENRGFLPGEVLPTHCFLYKGRTTPTYIDEHGWVLPSRIEPCGRAGVTLVRGLDEGISEALGIPPPPETAAAVPTTASRTRKAGRARRRTGTISLHLPSPVQTPLDWSDVEDALIAGVEGAGAGSWLGHGTDLQTGVFDIQFESERCDRPAQALGAAIRRLPPALPAGWYAVARYDDDDEEQVEP
jgi:hypothetical protein